MYIDPNEYFDEHPQERCEFEEELERLERLEEIEENKYDIPEDWVLEAV